MAITVTDLQDALGRNIYELLSVTTATANVIDASDLSGGGASVVLTVNGNTVSRVEGTDWSGATEAAVATSIASAFNGLALVKAFAEDAVVYFDPQKSANISAITSTAAAADMTVTLTDLSTDTRLTTAVNAAEDFVNSYLRPNYTLPFDTEPDDVKNVKVSMARHFLITSVRMDALSEDDARLYEQHIDYLEKVRKNEIQLGETRKIRSSTVKVGALVTTNDANYKSASTESWFKGL